MGHSAGGRAILTLLRHRTQSFLSRVAGVAFTDAVHVELAAPFAPPESITQFLASRSRDWVPSVKPLNEKLSRKKTFSNGGCGLGVGDPIPLYSAGTKDHIWTPFVAMDCVFTFLDDCLQDLVDNYFFV